MNEENLKIRLICNQCGNVMDMDMDRASCPYCGKPIDTDTVSRFRAYRNSRKEAERILGSQDRVEKILRKLEEKLKKIPKAGKILSGVPTYISLLRSYIRREYPVLPAASAAAILGALIYVLSPVDFIPDLIPGMGFLDDALVLTAVIGSVKADVDPYLEWRDRHA